MSDTARQICVRVRLFAAYREAAGTRQLEIPLDAHSTLADLIELLALKVPSLKSVKGLVAVNQIYVTEDVQLANGDEVAFIPPVSGG